MRRILLIAILSSFLIISLLGIQPSVATNPPTLQYTRTWGGSDLDIGQGVALDSSGNIYVAGYTYSFGPGSPGRSAVLLLKYSPSGILQWQRLWSGSGNGSDYGYGVAVDGAGNVYVAGRTSSFGAGQNDMLLLKFASNGSLICRRLWGVPVERAVTALH